MQAVAYSSLCTSTCLFKPCHRWTRGCSSNNCSGLQLLGIESTCRTGLVPHRSHMCCMEQFVKEANSAEGRPVVSHLSCQRCARQPVPETDNL